MLIIIMMPIWNFNERNCKTRIFHFVQLGLWFPASPHFPHLVYLYSISYRVWMDGAKKKKRGKPIPSIDSLLNNKILDKIELHLWNQTATARLNFAFMFIHIHRMLQGFFCATSIGAAKGTKINWILALLSIVFVRRISVGRSQIKERCQCQIIIKVSTVFLLFREFYISFFVVDVKHSLSLRCACAFITVYYCCVDKRAKSVAVAVAIAWFSSIRPIYNHNGIESSLTDHINRKSQAGKKRPKQRAKSSERANKENEHVREKNEKQNKRKQI